MEVSPDEGKHAALKLLCDAVARSFLPPRSIPTISGLSFDPEAVVALSRRHRVEALAALGFKGSDWEHYFETASTGNAMAQLRQAAAAREICATLEAKNIVCMTVKGPAVAMYGYRQPALRTSIDIDLLIEPGSFSSVHDILTTLGFVQTYPNFEISDRIRPGFMKLQKGVSYARSSDQTQLDLHWRAFRNPHLWPEFQQGWQDWVIHFDDGLWKGTPHLPPPQTLAYCLIHGSISGWNRLKWLADVHGLIGQMNEADCDIALEMLLRADMQTLTLAARDLCRDWFGTRFPQSWSSMETTQASQRLKRRHRNLMTASEARSSSKMKRIYRVWESILIHQSLCPRWQYRVRQSLIQLLLPNVVNPSRNVVLPILDRMLKQ